MRLTRTWRPTPRNTSASCSTLSMLGASRRKEGAELVDYLTRFHFLAEIEHQAGLGLLAARDLDQSVAADDKERVWYSAQAFLVATAIVSKLLWGGPSDAPKRAHL